MKSPDCNPRWARSPWTTNCCPPRSSPWKPKALWPEGGRDDEPDDLAFHVSLLWPGAGLARVECLARRRVSLSQGNAIACDRPSPRSDNDAGPPTIVGGGRYVVVQPGQAEVAFAIVDAYQGLGIGSALMRHLATLGRDAGLRELIAEVLAENVPMLNVFERSGLPISTRREGPIVHVTLHYS